MRYYWRVTDDFNEVVGNNVDIWVVASDRRNNLIGKKVSNPNKNAVIGSIEVGSY